MATAPESHTSQQFGARNPSCLDHMAFPYLDKNISMPCFPPFKSTANADLPNLYSSKQDAVGGFRKPLPPSCYVSYPTGNLYQGDSQCVLSHIGIGDKPVGASFAPPQRRFLIFDRSENRTRMFFGPSLSPQDHILASKTPPSPIALFGKVFTQVDQMKPTVEEKWDENRLSDGEEEEGDMLENTEEINALLYSDSDDNDDDEVSSTGHSPPFSLQEGKFVDEVTEEVGSCDEEWPKRRRLLDGKYKKSSLGSGTGATRGADPCSYEDEVESGCYGDDRSNKVRIVGALKMLESMIPGLVDKDPVSIIEGAVKYLKEMKVDYLKTEAESLGLVTSPQPLS